MPVIRLTNRSIPKLETGRWLTDCWDDRLTGFGVRAHLSGRKSYVFRYRHAGTRRRVTIGAHPGLLLAEARDRARELIAEVARGNDPQGEKQAARKVETADTFGAPCRSVREARSTHDVKVIGGV